MLSWLLVTLSSLSAPSIVFIYNPDVDQHLCNIDESLSRQALQQTGQFQSRWDALAPSLYGALETKFHQGFPESSYTVSLTACAVASTSRPLRINVRGSLLGRDPESAFIDATFHELLHLWIDAHLPRPSALLQKYGDEPWGVLQHLHLMAVQESVYEQAGATQLSEWIAQLYPHLAPPYPRAWQIVNQIEGRQAFEQELINKF